ncbi:hypothetical protein QQS21_001335 [Conoideocrella luteorostrata]|uniref:Uncharacterized protein n=1 Tax=Conoideocrella luteorostrata TaxID=1105319 RepID=A0AAJ0FYG1_9HYPO|nr:hypothetical protein QQS21_001335 [Conoideocrella luteorostrata]
MRLLQRHGTGDYSLTPDLSSDNVPPYAILSHTWGPEEVVFADLAKMPGDWQRKAGYHKIKFCAEQARRHRLQFFWVDTCCIDKSDNIELQTAINSMFRWYRNAKRCYVYLSDVSNPSHSEFRQSRWFTRGWTLQELIAPKIVDFYSREGAWLGDKQSFEPMIRDITGIPTSALRGTPLSDFPISEREAWVRDRETKYEEDTVYSLLGIFNVHMPLIYGEGRENALKRLREEVQKTVTGKLILRTNEEWAENLTILGSQINDFSVSLSLSEVPETQYFFAREREITEVHRTLSSDGTRRIVVLHGLGGIGKTQLVVAYIKRYRDEYSAIFWFNIKDELSIQQSFTRVARQILQQHPNASCLRGLDLQQNHEVVEAVKAWFSLPGNTRWLIVYDNYDNPKLTSHKSDTGININHFLPPAHQGSIIITTRSAQVDIGYQIRLRKLESMDDSLNILSLTSGRDSLHNGKGVTDTCKTLLIITLDAGAKKLVEKLDGLPLALASAGAYLRRVSMSLANYLRIYETSWARLHTSTPSLGSYEDRTLCSTWQVSYQQIQEQNPLAAHLLQWWAYFNNEDIWLELLQPVRGDGPQWIYELTDELNFNSAMGTLHDYGFVETYTGSLNLIESRGYSIHGCLHAWTIHILNQERDAYLGKLAAKCVASRVPARNNAQFWLLQRRLLPHAIMPCAIIQGSDKDLDWVFHNLGILYAEQGKLQEAEEMYARALQEKEKTWGPDHTSSLETVHSLGCLYAYQGKLQEAEEMFVPTLQGKEKVWGPDHTSSLATVHSLGRLYAKQGKLQEAKEMYARALQGNEKAWGPDHTSTLSTVNSLGRLYVKQGKLQEAEEMYARALQGNKKAWGPDHTSTLATVHNLGYLYAKQRKLQEAEEMYARALQGNKKAWGPDHTLTLDTVYSLGCLYADQGKLQEAEEMYARALQGNEKAWGPDHTSTLDTVYSLGRLYAKQGKLQEAEEMFLRALRGYEKFTGPQNIARYRPAINTMRALGSLSRGQGHLVEARRYYQSASSDLEGLLGPSHKDVQSLQNILLDLNRAIEARSADADTNRSLE